MLCKSRGRKVSVLQGSAMFPKADIQGSACLADVGVGALGTGMLTPFLRFAGTGSFRCTSSCRRVLKGRKLTWIARGANTLRMDSDNPPKYRRVNEASTSRSPGDPRSGCGQVCLWMKLFGYPFLWRACFRESSKMSFPSHSGLYHIAINL